MIINELYLKQNKSGEDINKLRDNQNEIEEKKETQKLLFKILNEIIIGTFSSYEGANQVFSLIKTKYFQFEQYYTYNQNIGYLCGFHSLFNIYYFLQYLTSKEQNKKNIALFNLKNAWCFWSFYKESINFLISNLQLESYAIDSLKNEGPLERYQFTYLLGEFPKIKRLFNELKENFDISFTKFLFGFGIFNGTIEEGIDFQKKINKFLEIDKNNKSKILIILLGIVNHWNVLILHKNSQNKIDIYLLDSRNTPEMFNSIDLYDDLNNNDNTKEQIDKIKALYINNLLNNKLKNKTVTKWYITCWKDWYDSMNKSLLLIFKILLKKKNLLDYIIENKINLLINNFFSKISIDSNNFGNDTELNNFDDINKEEIIKWIKEDYHPAVFNEEILNDIKKINYIIKEKKFIQWIFFMKKKLKEMIDDNNLNETEISMILRYIKYLSEIDKYIFIQK